MKSRAIRNGLTMCATTCIWAGCALLLVGCGEKRVVSTYKEVPKPVDASIVLPELDFVTARPEDAASVSLPFNCRFALRGRVYNAGSLQKQIDLGTASLRPKGRPKTSYADAFVTVEFVTNDQFEYSCVMGPVDHAGEMELQLSFDRAQPLVIPVVVRK
jgi:hypothetical protein